MPSSMIDSVLFKGVFSSEKIKVFYEDKQLVQNWLDIEAALAESQAELGMIPEFAANEIRQKAKVELLNFDNIYAGMASTSHSLVPTLREFQRICQGNAGEFIHYGATTQDIIDTGYVMATKSAYNAILEDLYQLLTTLGNMVTAYSSTIMTGRTHGQHALPITFGFKVAIWADQVLRAIRRMEALKEEIFVGQINGAVGSMAGFGPHALEVSKRTITKLGLSVPTISWASSRDRIADTVWAVAMAALTCGRIGNEINLLEKTEFSELSEGFTMGMIGSSTMPHKRNPNVAESVVALSKIVKANMNLTLESMLIDNERDASSWKIEWFSLRDAMITGGACVEKCLKLVTDLDVHPEKMLDNLQLLKGLIYSEKVMLLLGEKLGKQTAHEIIYEIAMHSYEQGKDFEQLLLEDTRVADKLSKEELDQCMDPALYLGQCKTCSAAVLNEIQEFVRWKNEHSA